MIPMALTRANLQEAAPRATPCSSRSIAIGDLSRNIAEGVGRVLVRLYWDGALSFGERDRLLDDFFALAHADVTGHAIETLGHWLPDESPPATAVIDRLKALWAKRLAAG